MKKIILLFAFVCFFLLSFSQQDTTFNKLIKSYPGTFSIRSLLRFNHEYYACVSQKYVTDNIIGLGILKLDSTFKIIDSNMYLYPYDLGTINNNGHGFDINKQDTSMIFCGTIRTQYSPSIKVNGYIVKFDKNLDTLWTLQIAHPDTAYADTAATPWVILRDVKVTPSGDYIVVGNYNYHCQGNTNRTFIIKLNSSGGIVWYKRNPLINNVTQIIKEIDLDPNDSGLFFVSYIASHMKLIKLDKQANFLWSEIYTNNPYPTIITSNKLIGNNIFIASANWDKLPSMNSKLLLSISKINYQTHNLIWEKTFPSINVHSAWLNQETIDIEVTPGGNIAVGSVGGKNTGNHFTADFRAQILMLNSNGDSLWSRYYTYSDNSMGAEDMQFNDMVVCPDGGMLFGGDRAHNAQFLDAWLVKTDSLGYAPYAYTVGIEQNELIIALAHTVKTYPNPANNYFNLGFEQSPKQNLQLQVYNATGMLVLSRKLPAFEKEYRIDIQELKAGVYFVNLRNSKGDKVYNGKIIKQ